ncbi:hypothetical protein Bbelb_366930, partial [Branchiostoma belcheri]
MDEDDQTWEEFAVAYFSDSDADDARHVIHQCSTSPIARCLLQNKVFWGPLCEFRHICRPPTITSFLWHHFLGSVTSFPIARRMAPKLRRKKGQPPEHHILNLDDEHLTDCEVKAFCQLFPYMKHLKTLVLSCSDFSADGALHLAQNLAFLTSLEELDLTENKIGDNGLSNMIPYIRHIYNLEVAASVVSVNPGLQFCSRQVALPSFSLKLNCTRLSDVGVAALAVHARTLRHVTELDLGRNCIGDDGAAALAKVSATYFCAAYGFSVSEPTISVVTGGDRVVSALDLGKNKIGDLGARALAEVFPRLRRLQHLFLWDCGITSSGAEDISNRMVHLVQLRELQLAHNDIALESLQLLVPGFSLRRRFPKLICAGYERPNLAHKLRGCLQLCRELRGISWPVQRVSGSGRRVEYIISHEKCAPSCDGFVIKCSPQKGSKERENVKGIYGVTLAKTREQQAFNTSLTYPSKIATGTKPISSHEAEVLSGAAEEAAPKDMKYCLPLSAGLIDIAESDARHSSSVKLWHARVKNS